MRGNRARMSEWSALRQVNPLEGERVFREECVRQGGRFRRTCAILGASYPHAWEWLRREPGRWERTVHAARLEVAAGLLYAPGETLPPMGGFSYNTQRGTQLRGKAWHDARARRRVSVF